MREKEEILTQIWRNLKKAPKDARAMLEHEYCFIEVILDIRDILAAWMYRPTKDKEEWP